jgi:hypothetical protein
MKKTTSELTKAEKEEQAFEKSPAHVPRIQGFFKSLRVLNCHEILVKEIKQTFYYDRFPMELTRERDLFEEACRNRQAVWKNPLIYRGDVSRE